MSDPWRLVKLTVSLEQSLGTRIARDVQNKDGQ